MGSTMETSLLRYLPFELAYLALLTRYGLKRLSRWEHPLDSRQSLILEDLGLNVAHVERRTLLGKKVCESIFSINQDAITLYVSRMGGRRLRTSKRIVRLEGFLFGYPSCCVEGYVRHPYARNSLKPQDQRILFHWACPGCKVTPLLLREYRLVHRECVRLFGGIEPTWQGAYLRRSRELPLVSTLRRKALPIAACLSALLLAPQIKSASDPHLLPVEDDEDGDYISFAEEILRGVDWHNPSTAQDTVLDGVALALELKALIDSLPETPVEGHPYKTFEYQYGLETCAVCGEEVNMGCIRIEFPSRGLSAEIPFIAYHYLSHGSLSYEGSIHTGRLDLSLLKRILLCSDESHQNFADSDHDGLESLEEGFIGTIDGKPDTDGDSIKDGPQYFEDLIDSLKSISREVSDTEPYMIEMPMDGVETCSICGNLYNMGLVEIVNPLEGISVSVPYISLHYLAHGSAAYEGSENSGRILPTVLNTVLNGSGTSHWRDVKDDSDGDGLTDIEEEYFRLDPNNPDSDGDGIPDGPSLAQAMFEIIDNLPRDERPDSVYRVDHMTRGVYNCLVCGEPVNMGYTEIVNPLLGERLSVSFLNLHFMSKGSFETDRPQLIGRIDPRHIDKVLGSPSYSPPPGPVGILFEILPNPSSGNIKVICHLPEEARFQISIYNANGRQVRDYAPVETTRYEVTWDGTDGSGRNVSPGIYFIRVDFGDFVLSKKAVLLRAQ